MKNLALSLSLALAIFTLAPAAHATPVTAFGNIITNPTANQVIVDTGILDDGNGCAVASDWKFQISLTSTVGSFFKIQIFDAAVPAVLQNTIYRAVPANGSVDFHPDFPITVPVGGKVVVAANSNFTGFVQGTIFFSPMGCR